MNAVYTFIGIVIILGIYALFAWGLSFLIAFVTGYDIGFWRTAGGMVLVVIASHLVFSGLVRGSDG